MKKIMSKNKCNQCVSLIKVNFDSGQEITHCKKLHITLDSYVISCTEFVQKGTIQKNMEEWEMLEYLQSIKPYIIEEKKLAGFETKNTIIIRPGINKDRNSFED